MKLKSKTIDADDRLTPEEERGLAHGIAQCNAGLTYGPFQKGATPLQIFLKRNKQLQRVHIEIPKILIDHLKKESTRFGMTVDELMVCILETHQLKDRDRQMIMLAADRASDAIHRKTPQPSPKRSGKRLTT